MRLWSIHPELLDPKGLVACWREALLAQKVLRGHTSGYRHHPQLERFRACPDPMAAIGVYLTGLAKEADTRGYSFNSSLIVGGSAEVDSIPVTVGQIELEYTVLSQKVATRNPEWFSQVIEPRHSDPALPQQPSTNMQVPAHPLFRVVPGPVASWERAVLE